MSEQPDKQPAVIAIVKGGLGNQLFIYATARALALRTGRKLYLDTVRGYTADGFGRSYRLDRFPIAAEPMPESWRVAPTLKHPRHKLIRAFNKLLPRNQRSYLAERRTQSADQLTTLNSQRARVTLLGYWQDEAYFTDQSSTIRRELTPPEPGDARNHELGAEMTQGESVFLHVRRVRYTPLLEASYYQTAIDAVRKERGDVPFYLFGDDQAWPVKALNFGGSTVRTVSHNTEDELADLWLMTRCKHAITANSSFSWWGAWLRSPDIGHVFAPEPSTVIPLFPARHWRIIPT
ncbi:alpha-1,2-fucosyltransferase [Rariglobus hedericola]|uniref:alpha-1,2-fucosyltransferase n=1 Tax=Rariglobus hedericola TaxID=2597822 RepID=UPI0013969422|nr:alpha-1,2-fucosyltransferase [Rariglobus hedericola]